jgi:hypothetical protein
LDQSPNHRVISDCIRRMLRPLREVLLVVVVCGTKGLQDQWMPT